MPPSKLGNKKDYTIEEALEEKRQDLQQTELEQNLLDGGQSYYKFTLKDIIEEISSTEIYPEDKDIASVMKKRLL